MRCFFIFILLNSLIFINSQSFSEIYKEAIINERNGNYIEAVSMYKKALGISPSSSIKEQLYLKIARISPDYKNKIEGYNKFISLYPNSKYRFLSRYELGHLYYLNNDAENAVNVLKDLSQFSSGTPYFIKSNLSIASIYINANKSDLALSVIYRILEIVEDYEETAECYYLAGKALLLKQKEQEALEYFLICTGNFPESYRSRQALLELVRYFISKGEMTSAELYAGLVALKYPNSVEYIEVKKIVKRVNKKEAALLSDEIISFKLDDEKKTSLLSYIRREIELTNVISDTVDGDVYYVEPGVYLQLGHFGTEENAKTTISNLEKKGITSLKIYRGIGADNYFFKVIIGPFNNRSEANQKVIEFKDNKVDSFIMEITRNYE